MAPSNIENKDKGNKTNLLRFLQDVDFFKNANFYPDDNVNSSLKVDQNNKSLQKKNFMSSYLKRILSENYEILRITEKNLEMRIHLPIDYLINTYNTNISNYGIIQYFNYPLLSPGNKNFSENVISINLYNSNFENQKIEKLKVPIEIFIKKPHSSFNNCLFIDPESYKWNDKGCISKDLGDILQCTCDHLTDFSIAKYNPLKVIEDMLNVLSDAWIINEFNSFSNLNFRNAIAIYIFFTILFIYFIGLFFAIKYDKTDEYDAFTFEVERFSGCCSTAETLENIKEVKQVADEAEEERLKISLKYLEARLDKYKIDSIIAKTLNLNVIIPEVNMNKKVEFTEKENNNNGILKNLKL